MGKLFISDLHLDAQEEHLTQLFLAFMASLDPDVEELYILGDLFEAWIGDDDISPYHSLIAGALKRCVDKGVRLFIMPGNRDFLLGETFMATCGGTLLAEPCLIDLYGVTTLLVHGDSLCTLDTRHQQFRRLTRNRAAHYLFTRLPLKLRRSVANWLRSSSNRGLKRLAPEKMDVVLPEALMLMKQYAAQVLIHGHTHKPSIEYLDIEGQKLCRIVLSDWGKEGNKLVCRTNGERRLINFVIPRWPKAIPG
jgi:UDP-2,3-diacylglucosamine hydrolase